jgi:hypothetical protein
MHPLSCHAPIPANTPTIKLSADLLSLQDGSLQLRYRLQGALDKLLIPALSTTEQKDNLWQHSCFEAFIGLQGEAGYYEYNFSPSRQWALYTFKGYRQVIAYQPQIAPSIEVTQTAQQLSLGVILSRSILPKNPEHKNIHIALSAVLETKQYQKSYWALYHPVDKPDFHHRGGFVLDLNPLSINR